MPGSDGASAVTSSSASLSLSLASCIASTRFSSKASISASRPFSDSSSLRRLHLSCLEISTGEKITCI